MEQSKQSLIQHLQSIIALIAGVVGPSVILVMGWDSISSWGRNLILSLISLVAFIYFIIPTVRFAKHRINQIRKRRNQLLILRELVLLLHEARTLYDPHLTCSIRYYVDSICNALAGNQTLHSQVKRLAERLQILSNWHGSLLTFAHDNFRQSIPFAEIVRDIKTFYHDTADVVRELATMKMPEGSSIRAYDDQRRIMKEKYNLHIGNVERVLERIEETHPELGFGVFHRF